jgi:uncharacterized membrane protein YgcG
MRSPLVLAIVITTLVVFFFAAIGAILYLFFFKSVDAFVSKFSPGVEYNQASLEDLNKDALSDPSFMSKIYGESKEFSINGLDNDESFLGENGVTEDNETTGRFMKGKSVNKSFVENGGGGGSSSSSGFEGGGNMSSMDHRAPRKVLLEILNPDDNKPLKLTLDNLNNFEQITRYYHRPNY